MNAELLDKFQTQAVKINMFILFERGLNARFSAKYSKIIL